jgi:hypothetical protein
MPESSFLIRETSFKLNSSFFCDRRAPKLARTSPGHFLAIWRGFLAGQPANYEIWGQIFKNDGTKQGLNFLINTTKAYHQYGTSVNTLSDGSFTVFWDSLHQDGSEWGVYGQLFGPDGSKVGEEFQVNTSTAESQELPVSKTLGGGKVITVWSDFRDSGETERDVYGQVWERSSGSMVRLGNEFVVNQNVSGLQLDPSIAVYKEGIFVVVFEEVLSGSTDKRVKLQVWDAAGAAEPARIGTEILVYSCPGDCWNTNPEIAFMGNNRFGVVYVNADKKIALRIYEDQTGAGNLIPIGRE